MEDPSAWFAEDVQKSKDWIYQLTAEDISEIDAALQLVSALEVRREVHTSLVATCCNAYVHCRVGVAIQCLMGREGNGEAVSQVDDRAVVPVQLMPGTPITEIAALGVNWKSSQNGNNRGARYLSGTM